MRDDEFATSIYEVMLPIINAFGDCLTDFEKRLTAMESENSIPRQSLKKEMFDFHIMNMEGLLLKELSEKLYPELSPPKEAQQARELTLEEKIARTRKETAITRQILLDKLKRRDTSDSCIDKHQAKIPTTQEQHEAPHEFFDSLPEVAEHQKSDSVEPDFPSRDQGA